MKRIQLLLVLAGALSIVMYSCSKDKVQGCTDPEACNFTADAEENNGSCTYEKIWYQDLDGDGTGNPYVSITDCNQPHGYVEAQCIPHTYYQDLDQDGLGNEDVTRISCLEDTTIMLDLGYVPAFDQVFDPIDALPDSMQRAIITYTGATWDSTSGNFGLPAKDFIATTYPNAVLLNVQGNTTVGDSGITGYILNTDFGPGFGAEFNTYPTPGVTTIPHIFMGAGNFTMQHQPLTTDNVANQTAISAAIDIIESTILDVKVIANAERVGDTVWVNTAVEFVDPHNEHWIGVYLLEDEILGLQNRLPLASTNEFHHNVVRSAAELGNPLGTVSMGPGFTAGQRVEGTYGIKVSTAGNAINLTNLKVAVIVYKTNSPDGVSNGIIVNID